MPVEGPLRNRRNSWRLWLEHGYAALVAFASLVLFAACGGSGDRSGSGTASSKLSPSELAELHESGEITFLDVRSAEEIRELGTLARHLHIPIDELEQRLGEIPIGQPVVTA